MLMGIWRGVGVLMLAAGMLACGAPDDMPERGPEAAPVEATTGTQTTATTAALQGGEAATNVAHSDASENEGFSEGEVDRSMLPADAPKDAEIVTDITPGKRGGRLIKAIGSDPKSFNPLFSSSIGDQEAASLLFAGLYGYDSYRQQTTTGLAKAWEYKADTQEWVFHLREGLKWSDGAPLTSDDVLFYTQLLFDEKLNIRDRFALTLDGSEGSPAYEFSAPDPLTFVAKIPGVDSFAVLNLGNVRALPRHKLGALWESGKFADDVWAQNVNPAEIVSSGPFRLKESRPGQAFIFEPNPHYYRYDTAGQRLPYVDEVILKVVSDLEATALQFMSGELHFLEGIKPDMLGTLLDREVEKGYKVYSLGPSLNVNHFYFNTTQGGIYTAEDGTQKTWQPAARGETPPAGLKDFKPFIDPVKRAWFEQVDFRRACSEAVNRDVIIQNVLYGEAIPLYGAESPADTLWFNPNAPSYPFNPEQAKARLESIGMIDKDGDGVREDAQGNPIRFTMVTNRENSIREKVAQLVASDLREVGIDCKAQVIDFNKLITSLKQDYAYEAVLMGLGSGIPPHPAMGANVWLSTGDTHFGYPSQKVPMTDWEAEIDRLYGSMKKAFKIEEQVAIYGQMQVLFSDNLPVISLFLAKAYAAAPTKLGNLKPTIIRTSVSHNIDELYFTE